MSLNLKEYQVLFAKFGAAFPEDPDAPALAVQRADGSTAIVTERSLIRSLVFACARSIVALEKESAVYAPALSMILKGGALGVGATTEAQAPATEPTEEDDLPPFQAQTTGIMPSVPSMGRMITTEAPQPYVPPAGSSAIVTTEAPQPYVPATNGKAATP